ncbi:MAG: ROK family protein [Hyphomicrobiaceae bacterium]
MSGLRIGIDLGGTKIEGVVLAADGSERARRRIAAPQGDYRATVAALSDLVAGLEQAVGDTATVGVGMPGSISPATGLVQNANSVWLNGRPLKADLEARMGRELRLANDANCFAVSEAADGAGAGAASVLGIILGTGCGGGIVAGGRIVDGPRGIGGEWGHNPLPWMTADEHPGPTCWCGRRGCMETWVSGPALAADHARTTGERIGAEDISRRAATGDSAALATLGRHADRLARGLAHVVNLLDPEVIVIGGGLSKLSHLYTMLPGLVAPWVFADAPRIVIRPPRWGDASGVRGAAWLWS